MTVRRILQAGKKALRGGREAQVAGKEPTKEPTSVIDLPNAETAFFYALVKAPTHLAGLSDVPR